MHSKLKIWQYSEKGPFGGVPLGKVLAYKSFDVFAFKYIKKSFDISQLEGNQLTTLLGSEVRTSWIEDNFLSLGLFGNSESFLIQNAEDLSEDVTELILNDEQLILENRFLILNFNKDHKLFKAIQKKKTETMASFQIQAPAFWEENELLNYLMQQKGLNLPYQIKEAFIDFVPFTLGAYCQTLDQITVNSNKEQPLDLKSFQSLLGQTKVDQFAIVDLLSGRKMSLFYDKMIKVCMENGELIPLLYLLQNHFIKVYDPSYLDEKKKITKYDRGILATAKSWKKNDLQRVIDYLGELITLAKVNQENLLSRLKSDQIKTIRF